MDINQISINKFKQKYLINRNSPPRLVSQTYTVTDTNLLMKELCKMANNNSRYLNRDFELNLSTEELEKRTNKDYLITKNVNTRCP